MFKRSLVIALFSMALTCVAAQAQDVCANATNSDKLVCFLPQSFTKGLTLAAGPHQGHFGLDSFLTTGLRPFNSAVGTQSSLLPLSSPSSGLIFTWDAAAKVFTSSTESLGPILGERAETIGKYKLFVGFSYQYFKFDSLDGVDLKKNLPTVFTHVDDSLDVTKRTCSINGDSFTECGFVRDVIKTVSGIDLKVHQFTTFVTFGLSNRIDVSAAIPIENLRMGQTSTGTIVNNSNSGLHVFPITATCGSISPTFVPCLTHSFSDFRSVSGIGDIILRVKGTAWKGERAAVALGVDVRVPTGDQLNFLGTGAASVRPFIVVSAKGRVAPHVLVGYETNGSSLLAGDTSTSTKARLPGQLTYSGGADVWLTKWFTAAFDLVGQQVFEAHRTIINPNFQDIGPCAPAGLAPGDPGYCTSAGPPNTYSNLSQQTGSYNISNVAFGAKLRPIAGLVITANVLTKLNDGGLRSKFVPLVGLSYAF